jgi:hypothetical protein
VAGRIGLVFERAIALETIEIWVYSGAPPLDRSSETEPRA